MSCIKDTRLNISLTTRRIYYKYNNIIFNVFAYFASFETVAGVAIGVKEAGIPPAVAIIPVLLLFW